MWAASKRDPLRVARASWEGNDYPKVRGECEDAYFDLCFHNVDPLDEEFQQTALAVFGPLLSGLDAAERDRRLAELLEERRVAYESAAVVVDTDGVILNQAWFPIAGSTGKDTGYTVYRKAWS